VLVLKKLKNGCHNLKLNKDSINGSINYSMKKREGEIDQNELSNNKYLITSKDSRRNKGNTSQSPSPAKSPFFYCEKSYPTDMLRSPLDQDPFFGPKTKVKNWLLLSF
jgi:hypothetical protein